VSVSQDGWYALVTYRSGSGPDRLGVIDGEGAVRTDATLAGYPGLRAALDTWAELSSYLRNGFDLASAERVEDAELVAPVRYPNKLICAGANYRDHVMEMNGSEPPAGTRPWFFCVPPTTTIVGPGASVAIPADPSQKVDWEAELAVVIGARIRDATAGDVLGHVAGYLILNDLSARGLGRVPVPIAPAMAHDWLKHKGQDGAKPTGPGMVPAWRVDPDALGVRLWVNDVLKQDGSTSKLIFNVAQLLADISAHITLEPGDIIATGTPDGVGMARGEFLAPGDTVRIAIEGLGELTTHIVAR
jgi:2-keto-4-pentenoate hydratase/2-oxohepta-3-ene-1,7-dioic acid hydratase in catechol pathway